ncbi:hypothetical protein K439DRAFT_1301036, partial [Ramaria rubella]
MNVKCPSCGALDWMAECLLKSSDLNPVFGSCCLSGKIQLPLLQDPPQPLKHLLESTASDAREFRKNILQYNNALAFTSLGGNFDRSLFQGGGGPYVFKLQRELYHEHLIPNDGREPVFAQLYIRDPAAALGDITTTGRNSNVNANTMSDLQEMLSAHNPLVTMYRQTAERLRAQPPAINIQARLTYKAHTDPRRYNIPTADEIAVILPGDGTSHDHRDIILQLKGGGFKRIHEGSPAYAPLHYVLLFPRGELGWHWDIPYRDEAERNHVSQIQYYAYRLFERTNEAKTILLGGKLLQEYIVDAWAASEQRRLSWIRFNQKTLRADLYNQVVDAFACIDNDLNPNDLGEKVILPATFQGSTRDMMENLQNSLAISRKYGNANLFITMTAN